jgi:predicted CopG family antitoxin
MERFHMAVKTITIDMDAYDLLAAEKRGNESFSKVIKRRLGRAHTAENLLAALPGCLLSDETLDRIEDEVRRRSDSPADSPIIDSVE